MRTHLGVCVRRRGGRGGHCPGERGRDGPATDTLRVLLELVNSDAVRRGGGEEGGESDGADEHRVAWRGSAGRSAGGGGGLLSR